jgi:hypothetical protein
MPVTSELGASFDLSVSSRFRQRIVIAELEYAATVLSENPTVPQHDSRMVLANDVLVDPAPWAERMALGCIIANGNIQAAIQPNRPPDGNNAAIADADIKAAVSTVWNFYASAAVAQQAV